MAYTLSTTGEPIQLFDLLEGLDKDAPLVEKKARWAQRSQSIRASVEQALGPFPERIVPQVTLLDKQELDGIVLQKLEYASWDGDRVPAYMLVRPDIQTAGAIVPDIMALHQTVSQGKDEVVGLSGREDLKFGWELAKRGYVVLAPDVLSAGERIYEGKQAYQTAPFQERYPEWSMMGKMIYDHQLGLDVLSRMPTYPWWVWARTHFHRTHAKPRMRGWIVN